VHVSVIHQTTYRYSVPVQLATHLVRLTPRWEGVQARTHVLHVQPWPLARYEQTDAYGNHITRLEFSGVTQQLDIESRLDVQTLLPAPLATYYAPLPWPATPALVTSYDDAAVASFARGLAAQVSLQVVPFLDLLAHTLYTRTRQVTRTEGAAQPAANTLADAQGSCRDLAVLFAAACRSQGIASRFASGYLAPSDSADIPRQMHAWSEVSLQGQWFGWDPALGRRASGMHICLCVAEQPSATLPVEGGYSFIGSQLTTTLDYDIRMRVIP
jgi:transglutaminase-like putative cysteine protease